MQSACILEKLQAMGSPRTESGSHWGRDSLSQKQISKEFKIQAVSLLVLKQDLTYCPGQPRTHYIPEHDSELLIPLLPFLPKC